MKASVKQLAIMRDKCQIVSTYSKRAPMNTDIHVLLYTHIRAHLYTRILVLLYTHTHAFLYKSQRKSKTHQLGILSRFTTVKRQDTISRRAVPLIFASPQVLYAQASCKLARKSCELVRQLQAGVS